MARPVIDSKQWETHSSWGLAECVFTQEFIGSDTSCLAGHIHSRIGISLCLSNAAFVMQHPVFIGEGERYTYTLYYNAATITGSTQVGVGMWSA